MIGSLLGCGQSSEPSGTGSERIFASFRISRIELRTSQIVVPGTGGSPPESRKSPHLIIINENETLRDVSVGIVTIRFRDHIEAAGMHDIEGVWEHGKGKAVEVSTETIEDIKSIRMEGSAVDQSGKRRKILFDPEQD